MTKSIKTALVSLLLLILVFPSVSLAQEEMVIENEISESAEVETVDSFELFWPIVAGKVMGDPVYFLKSLKERLREFLIFSSFKKADYNITLSEKRTVEAEYLFMVKKDYKNAKKSLDAAQAKRERALGLIKKAEEEGRYVVDLKNAQTGSLEKQRLLLNYLATVVEEEQKSVIEENVSQLNSLLSSLE